ncbi:pteridine reductase [Oceaniserpentilla sp. 4NH20-0058]|uniref:SDR family oxidoreductase n=1 Tax=Oceaniserpentilla sp. 4NH20-0058 TaxID=3127660 RepID=UPI00310501D5
MNKTVLITGGAQRIGAAIARLLHGNGYDIFLHFGQSKQAALKLQNELNAIRDQSCMLFSADLTDENSPIILEEWFSGFHRPLDVLVNNASQFFPTPWQNASPQDWQTIFTSNVQTPFFLIQKMLPFLTHVNGQVINLIDIHAERTLEQHPIYSASKAALKNLTLSLAKDEGYRIRCNGISPGAILWPDQEENMSEDAKKKVLDKVPMKRLGNVENIADTVLFLCNNDYINGQIINVDGGRTVYS